ncbi:MAG TPA: YegS/Rv2252/BmrU family lipid kinase [Candidatus Ozemobacteraceae bacterium]|nr:YegS/Rv2252/BmrU family lipid kinase [Candidatus Ozemobacteraceae bacterium]
MSLRRITLIANPRARGRNQALLEAAVGLLNRHLPTTLAWTERPGHAEELARRHGADPDTLVAVCGGDGTLCEAANGLPAEGVVGLIPAGTANVVARELGIPLEMREAAKLLLTGPVQRLDTGSMNGRRFLMSAGFGFDAHVAAHVPSFSKRLLGQYAFHLETLLQYPFYRPPRLSVSIDGRDAGTAAYVLCANLRRYGGNLFFAPAARPDDGLLDVVLFRDLALRPLLKGLWGAKTGRGPPPDAAWQGTARRIEIRCADPVGVQIDGELAGRVTTAVVEACPAGIRMVVP